MERTQRSSLIRIPHRDWTKGSILGSLLSLGWPLVVSGTFMMIGTTVDMFWVGKLGPAPMAGIGVAALPSMVVNGLQMGVYAGLRALVSRAVGSGDREAATRAAQQAFIVGMAFSVVMALVGVFLAETIMRLFGVAADVVSPGASYLRTVLVGTVFMSLFQVGSSTMQASGDTMNPMRIALIARALHMAAAPFLILGWGIFPRLGITGVAWVNILTNGLAGVLLMFLLMSGRTRLRLSFSHLRLAPGLMWRILRIGLPAAVNVVQVSLVGAVMMRFITPFGTEATAAHTIVFGIESIMLSVGMGFAQASGVLVGQNLGARHPERAERSAWLGVGLMEGITVIMSMVMFFRAEGLIGLFSSDAGVVAAGSTFLRIAAVGLFFMGFVNMLMESLNGAGDTMVPMIVGMATLWAAQIPLAFLLRDVGGLGASGVRWAMAIAIIIRAIIFVLYFRTGRWKYRRV